MSLAAPPGAGAPRIAHPLPPTPPPSPPAGPPGRWQWLQDLHRRHEVAFSAAFFVLGFVIDVLTLGRIDDVATLAQQAGYLLLLGLLLVMDLRYDLGVARPEGRWARLWRWSEEAVHFLFGSLLSTFTLFFFKSASGYTALAFLAVMLVLLIANELPRFRRLGPVVRLGLYAFCLTAYLAYLLPVVAGFLSVWLFLGAVALATVPVFFLHRRVTRWSNDARASLRRVVLPMGGVQVLLVLLYLAKAIPPVPLSVQYLGIYHAVERVDGRYQLKHQRPAWRIWHNGDQEFHARPGDKIHVFARIFAPRGFRDRVYLRFAYDDAKAGWMKTDRIPLNITGGRDLGFRGYGTKANYAPGQWRAEVETEDGRTVGVLRFRVVEDAGTEERVFFVDGA